MKITLSLFSALFLVTTFYAVPAYSQVENEANISSSEMRNMLNSSQIPVHRATNTEGSPFLYEEFHEGIVNLSNGYSTKPLQIRYNSHTQNVEFMSGNLAFSVETNNIDSFHFTANGEEHRFSKGYSAKGIDEDDIVEVAAEGDATLIIRHHTNFFEDASTYGQATQENRYVTNETFYLKVGDDDLNRIRRPNKRRILRNFDRFENELEQFADEHDLDFSDKDDLASLVKHYNSLSD